MKYVIFLIDGMADYPIKELGNKTIIEAADTPNMDRIAKHATFGTFLSLPKEFPTSSDVANMSVLGWDLSKAYTGRGAVESYGAGYEMNEDTVAFRLNLVTEESGVLTDFSAGHISEPETEEIIKYLKENLENDNIRIEKGVSYRNLLFLRGEKYSANVSYDKPDSSQGMNWKGILPKANDHSAKKTEELLIKLINRSVEILKDHPINKKRVKEGKNPANMIWPWSGGGKPNIKSFYEKYNKKGSIVSAVDVILGIGKLGKMDVVKPEGATGFIDTNYENKAIAAVELLNKNDFVYLHLEAADECGHMGDMDKKLQAIEDADKRLIGKFLDEYKIQINDEVRMAILPDHPCPISIKKHTRDLVPFMIAGDDVEVDDNINIYSEESCKKGKYVNLKNDELMKLLFSEKVK